MKQFILKNIVLVVLLALTLIGSIVLIILIGGKRSAIRESMTKIDEDVNTLNSINSQSNPRSVPINEERIKENTAEMDKKIADVYRHFGRPYRQALLQFLKDISSPIELKTDRRIDTNLVAKPKPKVEAEAEAEAETAEDGEKEEAVAEVTEEQKAEEKKVFDPENNRVVLLYDEDKLRDMLAEIYAGMQTGEASEENYKIPENIDKQRVEIFMKLFDQMIEPPEAVTAANSEAFRKAAAEKFAHAFARFRDDVQKLTLEEVTDEVAYEIFLDAVGLPREMREDLCKSYLETIARKYQESDLIPGLPDDDPFERQRLVRSFIYGRLEPRRNPPAEMVIPIIRNIQIKEDLFRRMKDSGISSLDSMTVESLEGKKLEKDSEDRILVFTYRLEMTASMEAIDKFIDSLHRAYTEDRVYVLFSKAKDPENSSSFDYSFKLWTDDDLIIKNVNTLVSDHRQDGDRGTKSAANRPAAGAAAGNNNLPPGTVVDPNAGAFVGQQQPAAAAQPQTAAASSRSEYSLSDPHHPDYGRTLIGETLDEVKCSLTVQYYYDTASNISTTP